MKTVTKLWILIVVLAVLAPIGLIVPEYFKSGGAWGEWGADEIKGLIGYMPKGLSVLSSVWNAPLPDYALKGLDKNIGYFFSAIIGIIVTAAIIYAAGKFLSRK